MGEAAGAALVRGARRVSGESVFALRWLAKLEAAGAGYLRRGVRGWALREEIERGTGMYLGERFPRLARLGLVTRESVGLSGRRPVWVFRVTTEGVRTAAAPPSDTPWREVPEPGPPQPEDVAVCLPPGARLALLALRAVADAELADAKLSPHGEWWHASGLALVGEVVGLGGFGRTALGWLETRGLAESRHATDAQGRPARLWRITSAGLVLPLLEWSDGWP